MRRVGKTFLIGASIAAVVLAIGGCPGGGGLPGGPGIPGKGGGDVNPNACGAYAASEAGAKIKAFLQATKDLNAAVMDTEMQVKKACAAMGKELGTATEGSTKDVCNAAFAAYKEHLQVGLKAEATLDVNYEPAVCEVSADVAASAAAKCEAKAEADIAVQCSGTCQGTCNGQCDGNCAGAAGTGGSGGECNGQCEGTCQGSCSGGCTGHANVNASAECEAKAEVDANISAKCTEPELDVAFDASLVVDKSKVEAAVRALKAGMPRLLMLGAKINGPLKGAVVTWVASAQKLKGAAGDISKAFKDQALCVSGQLAAAAGLIAQINVSIEVQVEVSASASGSVGG